VALSGRAAALALAIALSACGARGEPPREGPVATVVTALPPPPLPEPVELRPGTIWVRGAWQMRGGRWRWRPGHFERARVGQVWVGGHWQRRGDRFQWIEGRWRAAAR
jgi:hypothetical protein